MNIRPAQPADHSALVDLWLRSVRATHTFLTESDIQAMLPLVRDGGLASLDLVVLEIDGQLAGFMGTAGNKIEALFLAPEFHRRGGGRALVDHAKSRHPDLLVDVNEQNPAATRFYARMGFVTFARSELDGQGQPFPLLHMRLAPGPQSA